MRTQSGGHKNRMIVQHHNTHREEEEEEGRGNWCMRVLVEAAGKGDRIWRLQVDGCRRVMMEGTVVIGGCWLK